MEVVDRYVVLGGSPFDLNRKVGGSFETKSKMARVTSCPRVARRRRVSYNKS